MQRMDIASVTLSICLLISSTFSFVTISIWCFWSWEYLDIFVIFGHEHSMLSYQLNVSKLFLAGCMHALCGYRAQEQIPVNNSKQGKCQNLHHQKQRKDFLNELQLAVVSPLLIGYATSYLLLQKCGWFGYFRNYILETWIFHLVDVRGQKRVPRLLLQEENINSNSHYNQGMKNSISDCATCRTVEQMDYNSKRPQV